MVAAAVFFFLAGRRRRSTDATATVKEPAPSPSPSPERTPLGEAFHWFTWPVRKEDQAKRRLEENPPTTPEPPKDTSRKLTICGLTLGCGDTPTAQADESPEKKDETPSSLMGIVLKVLGAIATGIGVAGFVTVVGAAIFWVRFDAIGLPATQAVSVMPKAELLVQGAQEVTIFVMIGLGVSLLIAFADPKGIVTRGTVFMLGLFILIAVFYAAVLKSLPILLVLLLVGLAVFLALLCVGIAFTTGQRRLPLLVSVFLASLIFSSSCALLIVHDQDYAQAIAIRFGVDGDEVDKGLTGIYVTTTADTIYFARTGADPELNESLDTTGLYEVHRADTTTYAVGPLEPTDGPGESNPVQDQAMRLLRSLEGAAGAGGA